MSKKTYNELWDEFVKEIQYIYLDSKKGIPLKTIAIDFAKFVVKYCRKELE